MRIFVSFRRTFHSLSRHIQAKRQQTRTFSDNVNKGESFTNLLTTRQSQAARSIVVQVASEKSFNDVYQHCRQFGDIKNAFFYTIPKATNYILMEYDSVNAANETLKSSGFHALGSGGIPVQSRFLWLRNTANKSKLEHIDCPLKLQTVFEPEPPKLADILKNADSLSDQIRLLYKNTRLNDLSIRLRFIGALQVQTALSGLFLNAVVYPFGSTVNGFGKMGSDLDMILHYNQEDEMLNSTKENSSVKRLMFHSKGFNSESDAMKRETIQKHIRSFATIFDYFVPGVNDVIAIYKARIPIIRYFHSYLDVSVDVSVINMSGLYVSELFHMFGEMDSRVRPLVFAVRQWAKEMNLARKKPGSFTNFHITCLVLSFLQHLNEPILPTVNELMKQARPEDVRRTEDNQNYTFIRDLEKVHFHTKNTSSLEELFLEFLEYYGKFDMQTYMITLGSTKKIRKFEPSPLHIVNPFETEQNWGRNVTHDECAVFKIEAQNTLGHLVCSSENSWSKDKDSGLLEIFSSFQ